MHLVILENKISKRNPKILGFLFNFIKKFQKNDYIIDMIFTNNNYKQDKLIRRKRPMQLQLRKLIDEGERIEKDSERDIYNKAVLNDKGKKWIDSGISYLKEKYPESVLTSDFMSESEKADKDYHNMVAILKGLKDVEQELGLLDE